MTRTIVPFILSIAAVPLVAPQPPRDVPRAAASGTARITGVVSSLETPSRPLRRARVALNGDELPVGRTVITNDDGTFAFDGLRAGRYTLGATRDAYVAMNFGATRPGRPGTSVALRNGDTRHVTMRLPRGGVITGTVSTPDGQPAPGVTVAALAYQFLPQSGERRLATSGSTAMTDDLGVYRIFGLPAGEYVIAVSPLPQLQTGELQVVSDKEVRSALASLREGTTARSRPGIAAPAPAPMPAEPRRAVSLTSIYYPGTPFIARAMKIEVAEAQHRPGIDVQLEYVSTARISGSVSEPALLTMVPVSDHVQSGVIRTARAGADGGFTFNGVPPGQYTIIARVFGQPARTGNSFVTPLMRTASTDIAVDGDDYAGVALVLQSGFTIAGRVVFSGTAPLLPAMSAFNLPVSQAVGGLSFPFPPLQISGDGRFAIAGIVPGLYRVSVALPGLRTAIAGWWLRSVVVNDRDILDSPLEIRDSVDDAVVTFTDVASELSGTVTDAAGRLAAGHYVIAFATARGAWFVNSRRIAAARANAQGRYVFRNLPTGEYFVVASEDVEAGEWYDTTLLDRLTTQAARVSIGEHEKKAHDVTVR